ncbi:hypothetical protein [Candidatus Palauibacter sp.]|uniref:hypothetical protein n=1 Tax=Candidatus Palauibacter sp. TaxID=3101350 RepID=UPI003B59D57F
MPRSSVYALCSAGAGGRKPGKRGPKTELSDEELVVEIRTVLSESPFVSEGHRKVRARLCAFRRSRPPIPTSRPAIPSHADHVGERGSIAEPGCGLRVGVYRLSPVFVES